MTATDLSEIDLIRIRHLVEDHAGSYFGGPLNHTRDDAVRYTTDVVQNTYSGLDETTVAAAVTAAIDADPGVLNHRKTEKERVAAELARYAVAQAWLNEANAAMKASEPAHPDRYAYGPDGPHPYAVACIDAAERAYPDMPGLAAAREKIAGRWLRWRAGQITGQAIRLAQAGSQRNALDVLDAGADEFPDAVDWDNYRKQVREYHHLPVR